MGRLNRKRYWSVQPTSSGSADEEDTPKAWTSVERKAVLEYLLEYREQAVQVYHQSSQILNKKHVKVKARVIGSIEFPALTQEQLSRPYLALPKALTSKQRRMVHECCTEGE